LAAGLGASLGLLLCAANVYNNVVERLLGPLLTRPLFWVSGVFFSVESLPTSAREVLAYNPLLHVIDLIRDGVFPGYEARHVNAWYPVAWVLVLAFLGLTLERAARRRLQLS
jgi:capsular polysaccharide transport system permease protein